METQQLCIECELFLTQDKSLNLAEIPPTFELIQLSDRVGLKWLSKTVLGVVITLWKIFTTIEKNPNMLVTFLLLTLAQY